MSIPGLSDCRPAVSLCWKSAKPPTTIDELVSLDNSVRVLNLAD